VTGAEMFLDVLGKAGVDTIFGLPGSTEAALLEALRERPWRRYGRDRARGRGPNAPAGTVKYLR